jgi:hypothetical protein
MPLLLVILLCALNLAHANELFPTKDGSTSVEIHFPEKRNFWEGALGDQFNLLVRELSNEHARTSTTLLLVPRESSETRLDMERSR